MWGRGIEDELFRDRVDAGRRLGERLMRYRGTPALVLGVPRGGVPVAAEVARMLEAELDVIVARKLGAPGYPELAIGAVTSNGGRYLNDQVLRELGVTDDYLRGITEAEMQEARAREHRFRRGRGALSVAGKNVIIVDDGLATGATIRAAARSVRMHDPARTIVAAPVGSPAACEGLRGEADEVICLYTPETFWAVGYYYVRFDPVPDDDVESLLDEFRAARTGGRRA